MQISAVNNSSVVSQNRKLNFKSSFVPNKTLELAFEKAQKDNCKYFLSAMRTLLNDGFERTIEVVGGRIKSNYNSSLTETELRCGEYSKKFIGFPPSYRLTPEAMIGTDAKVLIMDYANTVNKTIDTKYKYMTDARVKEELSQLRKEILG